MGTCSNCRSLARLRRGRCPACYIYLRRNGSDRPWEVIFRTNLARLNQELEHSAIRAIMG